MDELCLPGPHILLFCVSPSMLPRFVTRTFQSSGIWSVLLSMLMIPTITLRGSLARRSLAVFLSRPPWGRLCSRSQLATKTKVVTRRSCTALNQVTELKLSLPLLISLSRKLSLLNITSDNIIKMSHLDLFYPLHLDHEWNTLQRVGVY